MKPYIYLAAQYSQKDDIAVKSAELRAADYVVTSTWTDEPHDAHMSVKDVTPEDLLMYAERDLREIRKADIFVLFTVDPDQPTKRGGRHVEFGYAMGLDVDLCIIGPRENIFHFLKDDVQVFEDWDEFVAWLETV